MKRVYINERSEVELKLMTYATKEAFESGPISGCQSLPDLKARLREYCQGEGHLEPPFVMINLDGKKRWKNIPSRILLNPSETWKAAKMPIF